MASPNQPADLDNIADAVVESGRKGFPVVWLLPLVAVLVGGWLVYKTLSEKGPEITIRFNTAAGIEQGKTKIKYRDVTVGMVDKVDFSKNLSSVVVRATMAAGVGRSLTDSARFWVVRPRIGASGVSGLGTLVSGAFIAMEPGAKGEKARHFTGLEKPPAVTAEEQGTHYVLRSDELGSLYVGAPVYLRQFDVGEITEYRMADDYSHVEIGVFVEAPHDQHVRAGSHFWNAGGINLSMSSAGIDVEMQSLVSLLSGGVAFETLLEDESTPRAPEGTEFTLYKNHTASLERPVTEVFTYAAKFGRTVRGLDVGAPVEFRGIRVGTVRAIELGSDPRQKEVAVPVVVFDIEPERTAGYRDIDLPKKNKRITREFETNPDQQIDDLVKLGLRARLQVGNLVTGKLYVEFDMFPDAEPATIKQGGLYPEMPTIPSPFEGIVGGIGRIVKKLEKAELEATLDNLNQLMASSNSLVQTLDTNAPALAAELRVILEQAHDTLESFQAVTSTEGEIGNELYQALAEITAAARSIRLMSEYLERHPDALIKGKNGGQ